MAENTIELKLDTSEFQAMLEEAVARIEASQQPRDTLSLPATVAAVAAAACASPRKFSRRSLFGLR